MLHYGGSQLRVTNLAFSPCSAPAVGTVYSTEVQDSTEGITDNAILVVIGCQNTFVRPAAPYEYHSRTP